MIIDEKYVGKIVKLIVDKDLVLVGKLSNHKPNLYQVTGKYVDNHIVFWDHEISGIFIECDSINSITLVMK
jgi:hypothetical protein